MRRSKPREKSEPVCAACGQPLAAGRVAVTEQVRDGDGERVVWQAHGGACEQTMRRREIEPPGYEPPTIDQLAIIERGGPGETIQRHRVTR